MKLLNTAWVICGFLAVPGAALAASTEVNTAVGAGQASASAALVYTAPTQSDKYHHFVADTFSIESVVRAAAGAAILQGMNTPGEWGQGAEGYSKRFASDYAEHVIRQSLMFGASSALGEDNRYFLSQRAGAGPRLSYALESTFLARTHSGHRRLSYSRIGSVVATAFISRTWQPRSTNGGHNAELSIISVFGAEAGFNVAREFLPRIFHTRTLQ